MAVVGPGASKPIEDNVRPTLEGASEYEYITIRNILTDDFAIQVAQDVPVNMPVAIRAGTSMVQDGRDVTVNYGLDLKNPDFKAKKHIVNNTIIKAGKTINLKGNEAQVAVKQLVDEILQREGNKRLLADPTLRKQVEDRIIVHRGSISDILDNSLQTPSQQIDDAILKSNEVKNEQAFPGLTERTNTEEVATETASIGAEDSAPETAGSVSNTSTAKPKVRNSSGK